MQSGGVIVLVSLGYLLLLFAIAYWGDRRAGRRHGLIATPTIYALSIAVYCTSWTFFGSVGRASATGVGFLPIYLGPTLMFLLGWFVIRKIIRISKENRITSIADFIASRYGKTNALGGLVTLIAVIGILPYISLQLKAISMSFSVLVEYPAITMPRGSAHLPLVADTAFWVALLMAAFAILFGTRQIDASERHDGMVAAIAFESVVKLIAFIAVGVFVTFVMFAGPADIFARAEAAGLGKLFVIEGTGAMANFAALTLLAAAAILVLPRQFQVVVVENADERHLRTAIWLFPLYLFLINLFVLPIAFGGLLTFPKGGVDPDTFVLTLPMAEAMPALALLAFLGGLSAATGMIVVETVALATMVCNDLLMPLLFRVGGLHLSKRGDLTGLLLAIRRSAIVVIVLLGYGFERLIGESYTLATIGLVSFVAAMQWAPPILGGIFWKGATRAGAIAGLTGGFVAWLFMLLVPSFALSGWIDRGFVDHGLFGLALLKPYAFLGLSGLDPITHATVWTLAINVGLYVGVSLVTSQDMIERSQAIAFVDVFKQAAPGGRIWRGRATVGDLRALLARFIGEARAEAALQRHARESGAPIQDRLPADSAIVSFTERQLAGAIGAASARIMLASVLREEMRDIDAVMQILDEASQLIVYSRRLEAATAELRAANERLKELDKLKDDFVSTVSHELRTPLTSIRSFSEIVHDNPELPVEERNRFLAIIVTESERLTRLINDILDHAKMEAGEGEWTMVRLDPRGAIEAALDATSGLIAKSRTITLETDIAPALPAVVADRDRLTQVLVNLISNAVKFCDKPQGRVRVTAGAADGDLLIAVSDNGAGIAPADQATIFERFRQAGSTLTGKPQGTGLGLPISRRILAAFGGTITVESAPGAGATFRVRIPAAA